MRPGGTIRSHAASPGRASASERWPSSAARHWSLTVTAKGSPRASKLNNRTCCTISTSASMALRAPASPMPPVRHVVSDDVDLIPQARQFAARSAPARSGSPGSHSTRRAHSRAHRARYRLSAIQSAPHRRRTEDIIYERHAQDTDRDRRHSIGHRCEHTSAAYRY